MKYYIVPEEIEFSEITKALKEYGGKPFLACPVPYSTAVYYINPDGYIDWVGIDFVGQSEEYQELIRDRVTGKWIPWLPTMAKSGDVLVRSSDRAAYIIKEVKVIVGDDYREKSTPYLSCMCEVKGGEFSRGPLTVSADGLRRATSHEARMTKIALEENGYKLSRNREDLVEVPFREGTPIFWVVFDNTELKFKVNKAHYEKYLPINLIFKSESEARKRAELLNIRIGDLVC